mmetsp:Transcript_53765/g.94892  ORF Transcript_53765/g.94892 Transcript_53765/m.94892 type:complete len:228 (+) Transcript_53765:57-740(+)
MTTKETKKYKEQVRVQLEEEGVRTFKFDAKLIEKVERSHAEVPPPSGAPAAEEPYKFQPLYGGSHGQWPWAVMGADGARREYLWGTAETNHPHHSELPALRDLILREGGWQHLKREASLMVPLVPTTHVHTSMQYHQCTAAPRHTPSVKRAPPLAARGAGGRGGRGPPPPARAAAVECAAAEWPSASASGRRAARRRTGRQRVASLHVHPASRGMRPMQHNRCCRVC